VTWEQAWHARRACLVLEVERQGLPLAPPGTWHSARRLRRRSSIPSNFVEADYALRDPHGTRSRETAARFTRKWYADLGETLVGNYPGRALDSCVARTDLSFHLVSRTQAERRPLGTE